jgi:hypothetical protein
MQKTRSEELFERYCLHQGYGCQPIPTGAEKSSDYSVRCGDQELIVEVKELCPNDDDRRRARELREQRWTSSGDRPGRRAHELIKRAASQLGRYRDARLPCVALLYDNIVVDGERAGIPNRFLEPAFIDFAMYGLQTVNIAINGESGSMSYVGDGRGGKRQTTPSERTYLSAVAVLYEEENEAETFLVVYHNYFASVQLPRNAFSGRRDLHFVKPGNPDLTPQMWVPYEEMPHNLGHQADA